jgi:tetratricopeptide (TPR) repeat protein
MNLFSSRTAQLLLVCAFTGFSHSHAAEKAVPRSPAASILKPAPVIPANGEIPAWVARLELARVLSYAKRYDEAITEYRKLFAVKPDLMEARIEMANVMAWKGDLEGMRRILEHVPRSKLDPKSKLLLAEAFVAQKEYDRAEKLFREYLGTRPEDQRARLKLAEVLSWQKKYDASLAEYEKLLKARPGDIQVRRKYAFVLIWKGSFNEAALELRKTLKDDE